MIVFELICAQHHRFEGWFASHDDFGSQKNRGLLNCPVCSDHRIDKFLTAKIGKADSPYKESSQSDGGHMSMAVSQGMQLKLRELIDYVLSNTEDVGKEFAAEARKIHYNEAPKREIRGTASVDEAKDLLEEGIPVLPLPIPPKADWH